MPIHRAMGQGNARVDTSIKWTSEMVPRVSRLERFHCSCFVMVIGDFVT